MADVDRIVEVHISKSSATIQTANFSVPLVLFTGGEDAAEGVQVATSLEDVVEMYGISSTAYTIAQGIFRGVTQAVFYALKDDESYEEALFEVLKVNNDWYALLVDTKQDSDILALAAAIEAMDKVFFYSTDDGEATGDGDSAINKQISDLGYERTIQIYHSKAGELYPEASWVGDQLPEVAGSNTWALKQATGVTPDNLSGAQIKNLEDSSTNYFIKVRGISFFMNGVTASGEWIDTVIFLDWVKARIQEVLLFRLASTNKIAMSNDGMAILQADIMGVLEQGIRQGGISTDAPYYVTPPDTDLMSPLDRSKRVADHFEFGFRLAGAVHKTVVRGFVTQ